MKNKGGRGRMTPLETREVLGNTDEVGGAKPLQTNDIENFIPAPPHVRQIPESYACWKKTLPMLLKMGILSKSDLEAFAAYCLAVGIYRRAAKELKRGLIIKEKNSNGHMVEKKNPAIDIINAQMLIILKFSNEFGLTPISRTRVAVKRNEAKKDKIRDFIKK